MTNHAYPRLEWTPCSEPPSDYRRVLVWHRCRPYCRFHRLIMGWWNGYDWRWDCPSFVGQTQDHGLIWRPKLWRDVESPKDL